MSSSLELFYRILITTNKIRDSQKVKKNKDGLRTVFPAERFHDILLSHSGPGQFY